jgi:hypothetical protein
MLESALGSLRVENPSVKFSCCRATINGVVLQSGAKPVDQSMVESGFVAISGVVDTCSISTGDGWTEGRNRFGNSFGLRFVVGSKILSKVQELGCV